MELPRSAFTADLVSDGVDEEGSGGPGFRMVSREDGARMAMTAKKSVVDILLEKRLITADQAATAKAAGGDPRKVVVEKGFATEVDAYAAWAASEGLPFVDLTKHRPESTALNVVPQALVEKHNAIPVRKQDQILFVAMADPRNIVATDEIRLASKLTVRAIAAAPGDIAAAIKASYGGTVAAAPNAGAVVTTGVTSGGGKGLDALNVGQLQGLMNEASAGRSAAEAAEDGAGEEDADKAPVVRLVNAILVQAIDTGASDIHIEPNRRNLRVRFRIDGVLREIMPVPKLLQAPVIARCKIMAEMNIAERRIPQDGRIALRHSDKDYDMRVSCLPSLYGEKIVMRILDKSSTQIGLNRLGFQSHIQGTIETLVAQPNGMFIVTGPTGSGKTTTLYSILNKLNNVDVNIVTVEDPVEYELTGVTQVGINKKAGLNFNSALRCFLRQDPDIIMVGEMRDLETADIAIESALTGHLVLSTLHTNDAPSATLRLADMGVEPFLISATMIGILAQRLARTNCANCAEEYEAPAAILASFGYSQENPDAPITLRRGRGCDICGGTGFKGRTGVHELVTLNDEIAEMIVRRSTLVDLRDAARRNGYREMREDGLDKILNGSTAPKEVARVVFTAGH